MDGSMSAELNTLLNHLAESESTVHLTPERKVRIHPKLDAAMTELARKYKEDLIEMVVDQAEIEHDLCICRGCLKTIADEDPALSIEMDGVGGHYFYHVYKECQMAAEKRLLQMLKAGEVYWIHHHHVCGDEANGYNCKGGCFR